MLKQQTEGSHSGSPVQSIWAAELSVELGGGPFDTASPTFLGRGSRHCNYQHIAAPISSQVRQIGMLLLLAPHELCPITLSSIQLTDRSDREVTPAAVLSDCLCDTTPT